jgi:beta,beta-carotene 9',10'-dioxygenase
MNEYYQGFSTLQEEITHLPLEVTGEMPDWLQGTLVRNGPAKFHMGEEKLHHWFDGYAMLHGFKIDGTQVFYTNSFVKSDAYQQGIKNQKICFPEFSTNPKKYFLKKLLRLANPLITDNTNVNIAHATQQHIAMTETSRCIQYDPNTLETLGHFEYLDNLTAHLSTAHPLYDYASKETYNLAIQLGRNSYYHFYKIPPNSHARELIISIPVKNPAYIHSFAMTENYLILVEPPFRMSPLKFLFSTKPFIENYHWDTKEGTRITVIDKHNGNLIFQDFTDPFFMFHQINAFEAHQNIYIDLSTYADSSIIQSLYLKNLAQQVPNIGKPERLCIDLTHKKITREKLCDCYVELPRINEKMHSGRLYQYTYAASALRQGDFLNQLVKIDVTEGSHKVWARPYCYPGEPVFVKNTADNIEDSGIVLSVVLDAEEKNSFLLVLDAGSFQELARCSIPHVIPFGFHGEFYTPLM